MKLTCFRFDMCALGASTLKNDKWHGKCLYCYATFSGGDKPIRRFSLVLGEFHDIRGRPIPLKYLCSSSNRWFHQSCSLRSLRTPPADAGSSADEASSEQSSTSSEVADSSDSTDDEAAQNLQLLSSPTFVLNPQLSTLIRQATVQIVSTAQCQHTRVPSTLLRSSTKYDLFSALYLSIFSLT